MRPSILSPLLLLLLVSVPGIGCELTMGYRTSERLPYIHAEPSDNGLFVTLFDEAAKRIGCRLTVIRAPKQRIIRELEQGNIDFYPSLSFTPARAKRAWFFPNGLPERYTGISREKAPDIKQLNELVTHNMVLLMAPGSYDLGGLPKGLAQRRPQDMDIPKAFAMLRANKGDFFIYDEFTLEYYLHQDGGNGLKRHPGCCEKPRTMFFGFSRKSPHFQEIANPDFIADKPVSAANQPVKPAPDSVAARLVQALTEMMHDGTITAYREAELHPELQTPVVFTPESLSTDIPSTVVPATKALATKTPAPEASAAAAEAASKQDQPKP
ncbi:substrate-binding periplasmic protein [Shewanella litorisediminis]|nr:transporter substrate-binding domain-containing protein [Shewanella litorisediminis]MCL2917842.1 transporter substrate-binding domain-containing protein [Shewanella litorisediminis]